MNKWIAEFDLEDGDTMPEHMDLEYKGARIDFHCRPLEQEPTTKNDLGVDCISRDEACRYVAEFVNHEFSTREEEELIDNIITGIEHLPSVTPQEPRKGHWIHRENMDYLDKNKVIHNHFMCQDCGFIHDFIDGHTAQYKYCPNCGAKMESEDNNDIH